MKVYAIEERTPEMNDFETFMICSTFKKAYAVSCMYSKNYPQNEYGIKTHIVDDKRLIEIEKEV